MIILKPCPFCGSELVDYDSMVLNKNGKTIYAKCPGCKTNFRVLEHIYNTRPIEDALRKRIEELEKKD